MSRTIVDNNSCVLVLQMHAKRVALVYDDFTEQKSIE
jgi:hypothetical protein